MKTIDNLVRDEICKSLRYSIERRLAGLTDKRRTTMTLEELRDLYGCLKDRAINTETLPSFAAVKRAKQEGRIVAEQGIESGKLIIVGKDEGKWNWSFEA